MGNLTGWEIEPQHDTQHNKLCIRVERWRKEMEKQEGKMTAKPKKEAAFPDDLTRNRTGGSCSQIQWKISNNWSRCVSQLHHQAVEHTLPSMYYILCSVLVMWNLLTGTALWTQAETQIAQEIETLRSGDSAFQELEKRKEKENSSQHDLTRVRTEDPCAQVIEANTTTWACVLPTTPSGPSSTSPFHV